jgi:hypothetical protein
LTVGLAEDPPFQVSVFTGYEESNWSAPVARVLYLVVDLARPAWRTRWSRRDEDKTKALDLLITDQ